MSKYHINSKGVPGLCRATKGNCPYGGDESHYDSKEDAQKHADLQNEKEYGLIGQNKEISITTKANLNNVFVDPYGYGAGKTARIVTSSELEIALEEEEEFPDYAEFYKSVKNYIPEVTERFAIIPKSQMKAFAKEEILSSNKGSFGFTHINEFESYIINNHPEAWDDMSSGLTNSLKDKISDYIVEEKTKDSKLIINGEKMIIEDFKDRNWVKEYYESKSK